MITHNMEYVGVYILTHNRLSTLKVALESVLRQTYKYTKVIVSDNSDNLETELAMKDYLAKYENLSYIHHYDASSSSDHIQKILSENTYELYMLFHDDDEMLPNMVEELCKVAIAYPAFSAVAANALLNKDGNKTLAFKKHDAIINGGEELISRYSKSVMKIAPFPSYLYRKSIVYGVRFDYDHKGGKYCDVSYLYDIANRGAIFYVGQPLMIYNIHDTQDSANFDFLKHVQLTNYLKRTIDDKSLIENFRLRHIYTNIVDGYKTKKLQYRQIAVAIFVKYNAKMYLLKYFFRLVQSRIGK